MSTEATTTGGGTSSGTPDKETTPAAKETTPAARLSGWAARSG